MKKIFYLLIAAAIGTAAVACSDDDNADSTGSSDNGGNGSVKVEAISLDNEHLELTVGDTQQLTATVTPDNAEEKSVTWTSDKPEFVTVDNTGMVTAVAAGEAAVTAAAGGKSATCVVTVTNPAEQPAALIKTIRIPGDTEGFYTQIDLTRAEDGKVTAIRKEQHTPEGTQGEAQEAAITYEAGKAAVKYQEWGENYEIVFTLNAEGYAAEAKKLYEGADDGGSLFAYGSNGMLEKITTTLYGETADLFGATYDGDKNWKSVLLDPEEGKMAECTASSTKNNAGIDLNMFMIFYGQYVPEIDYAIICGLIPATPNLLKSSGALVFKPEADATGAITSVEIVMGFDALKYTFGY